jgi:hypothetical protein
MKHYILRRLRLWWCRALVWLGVKTSFEIYLAGYLFSAGDILSSGSTEVLVLNTLGEDEDDPHLAIYTVCTYKTKKDEK